MQSEMKSASGGRNETTSVSGVEEKDREIWVEENRLYLGEDNILYISRVGDIDEKLAILFREKVLKLIDRQECKINFIVDLAMAGKEASEARKIFKEISENNKVEKISMIGIHRVARILASYSIGLAKKKDVRFFNKREDAITWLKK